MPVTSHRLKLLANLVLFALASWLVFSQLMLFWAMHAHLPLKDTWHILPLVKQVLTEGWSSTALADWLQPHAGAHRILLTRLLMTLDYQLFSGRNHMLYASGWLALAWLTWFYSRALATQAAADPGRWLFAGALAAIFLFAPGQFFNLLNPINASWFTALAFATGAISLSLRPGALYTTSAFILAMLAAFSNFSGALVMLLLPLATWLSGTQRKPVLLCTAAALAFLWFYQLGIQGSIGVLMEQRSTHPELADKSLVTIMATALSQVLHKTLLFLGSPLTSLMPRLAAVLSLGSLLYLGALLVAVLRRPSDASRTRLQFMLTGMLCAGIAFAAQLGRLFFDDSDALRYQSVVMLYWLNICALVLAGPRSGSRFAFVALVVLMLILVPTNRDASSEAGVINSALRSETLARLQRPDLAEYRQALPLQQPDPLPRYGNYLSEQGLAFAADLAGSPALDQTGQRRISLYCDKRLLGELRRQLRLPFRLADVVYPQPFAWEGYLDEGEHVRAIRLSGTLSQWQCPAGLQ